MVLFKPMRILLIEDNHDHAELIERSLDQGIPRVRVQLCVNAKEAYRLIEENEYDLILTDFYLPDAKGDAHIRQLNKRAPEVPVVVITGQGDEKTAARSIKAGAEDYVVKTREVLAALPKILKRSIVKHNSHQNKRRKELQKHLNNQKQKVKKVLGEVAALDRKVKTLKKGGRKKTGRTIRGVSGIENLMQRIESLKRFVRNIF